MREEVKKNLKGQFLFSLIRPGIATAAGKLVMVMYDTIAARMFAVKPQKN